MRLKITSAVHAILYARFMEMLRAGEFPKVNYQKSGPDYYFPWETYNMLEYSVTWSTFAHVVDRHIKNEKLDERLGVFTRKHGKSFLQSLQSVCEKITSDEVNKEPERFRTSWD